MYGASSGTSSGFLEDIPIMISEQYQPTIYRYEVPPSIENSLNLSTDIYQESPLFKYDFQHEREVINHLSEFRRNRQLSRDRRTARKLQRDEERRRQELELQQKKLASISYPSTEDLCFTTITPLEEDRSSTSGPTGTHPASMNNSFYNILQPIVLSNTTTNSSLSHSITSYQQPQIVRESGHATALASTSGITNFSCPVQMAPDDTFNIKDFESDTSSPFDNMELKTINDLDILAQVLHNTQLSAKKQIQSEVINPISNTSLISEDSKSSGAGVSSNNVLDKFDIKENLFQTPAMPNYNGDKPPSLVDNAPMDNLLMKPHLAS